MREIKITGGKTEFETFKTPSGKKYSPCINDHNVDFAPGCIANINPYFLNGEEIVSGKILEQNRDKILGRLDDRNDERLEMLALKGLYPEVRRTKDFPEQLKQKIWETIKYQVNWYQTHKYKDKDTEEMHPYNAEHLDGFFKSGIGMLDGLLNRCKYCYARQNNKQDVLADGLPLDSVAERIDEIWKNHETRKDKKGKERLFIRMGKRTEASSLFHLHKLNEMLDLCLEKNVHLSIPTKFLPYEKTIDEKIRATGSKAGYSNAYESEEPGVVLWGFDTDYRLHCAEKYGAILKISWDSTPWDVQDIELCGGNYDKLAPFIKKLNGQIIPMRMHKHKVIEGITGEKKAKLIKKLKDIKRENAQEHMFTTDKQEEVEARFLVSKGQRLIANRINPELVDLFGNYKCGQIGDTYNCDSCQFEDMPVWGNIDMKSHDPLIDSKNKEKRLLDAIKERREERQKIFSGNLVDDWYDEIEAAKKKAEKEKAKLAKKKTKLKKSSKK